jgi:hypothetical protein
MILFLYQNNITQNPSLNHIIVVLLTIIPILPITKKTNTKNIIKNPIITTKQKINTLNGKFNLTKTTKIIKLSPSIVVSYFSKTNKMTNNLPNQISN